LQGIQVTLPLRTSSVSSGKSLLALALVLALSACSSVGDLIKGDRVDYKSAGQSKSPSLDVPPDLTQLSRDARYAVPGGTVTASGYQAGQATGTSAVAASTAPSQLGDVRIERAGNQRWLVVKRPPEALWDTVREFWQENGFLLTIEQANTGIIETDFAENRAKLPQDFIRRTIGKVFDGIYSTGERDKFRTRLERSSDGTEIYISHRGMVETVPNASTGSTIWQPRPADPELETEFLRRLMVKLGVPGEQARTVATVTQQPVAQVAAGSQPTRKINEGFDRAWRRVGLSLDRTSFTVEDRDRAQGLYFVRYVEPTADKKDPGFFGRMFSSTSTAAPLKLRISVRGEGQTSTVAVLNAEGAPDTSANAKRILQLIAEDLR
jgi:outer membrane protein assembly factor BamC